MAAESAVEMVKLGFTALKFDPAGPYTIRGGHHPSMRDIEKSVLFCKAIRDAVGTKADLLFGTHGQFNTAGAIRLGRRLEVFDPLWFEEPIPPDNLLEFANVAKQVRIPIATGERMTTKAEFGAILRTGGASILQPALGRSGGILETKKIAALAEVYNAQIAPHLYAGPVEWAANIQLAANIPNLLLVETIQTGGEFHLKLIKNSITWEDGYINAPTAAGLGIEFDEKVALENPYTGKELHLQMTEAGCDYQNKNDFLGGAPPRKN
jgi:L-alanine-DL-glutamate epimerase-like enolase superfamily enzyme